MLSNAKGEESESGRLERQEEETLDIVEPLCAVFRRKLRSEGLKYTPERAQVLDTIVRHDGLFDADMVIAKVKGTGIRVSKATVYRTMKLLQEAGVIHRVWFDGDIAQYQLVYGRTPRALLIPVDISGALVSASSGLMEVEVAGLLELCEAAARRSGQVLKGYRLHVFVGPQSPTQ